MPDRVDRTERLLNLVFALMATSRPVPRSVLRDQVPGYREAASDPAFERMFERDKDELRSMGVPVETVIDESGEVLGYRIPRDAYAMAPLDLTLAERSAVAVAAQVWGQASVAAVAGTAVRKLEAVLGDAQSWVPAGLAGEVVLGSTEAALLPLLQAIRTDRIVTFPYRTPAGDTAAMRTVSPWRLASTDGHWRLTGHDHDRRAERTFRLSRIQGPVTLTARSREPLEAAAGEGGEPTDPTVRATVHVEPWRGASLRRAATAPVAPGMAADIEVAFPSMDALVGALCAAGADATVLRPAEVVDRVHAGLLELHRLHQPHVGGSS